GDMKLKLLNRRVNKSEKSDSINPDLITDLEMKPFFNSEDSDLKKTSNINSSIDEENYFFEQSVIFQKRRVYIIGPLMFLITLAAFAMTRSWQLGFESVLLVFVNIFFWIALKEAKNKRIESSLWFALIPTLVVNGSIIILLEGFETVMILTAIALVVQTSVFSNKVSLVGSIAIFIFIVADKIIDSFGFFTRYSVAPVMEFSAAVIIGFIMVVQFWVYLKKHKDNYSYFLDQASSMNSRQDGIISTISKTIPEVEKSVDEISNVASDVADKSTSQASSIVQVSSIVQELLSSTYQTNSSAQETNVIANNTKGELELTAHRMLTVEKRFESALTQIGDTLNIMKELLEKTDQIESILAYNRDIGEHIKVLSVNASIEAAAAGEFGLGFGVVASELRDMIDNTETNLVASKNILNSIRERSKNGMNSIKNSTNLMHEFYDELKSTAEIIVKSVHSFSETAGQVEKIVSASMEQQSALKEVNFSVDKLQKEASELASSSRQLTHSVKEIEKSKARLSEALI
ncbi:MAG: hypothetical protein JXR91_16610, partial [Deltaproteobacteria bacterium]|nr:hypothetical protein [Deltaproteobacteria bacterium]